MKTEIKEELKVTIEVAQSAGELSAERVRTVPESVVDEEELVAPKNETREVCVCCFGCFDVEKGADGAFYAADTPKNRRKFSEGEIGSRLRGKMATQARDMWKS